MTREKQNSEKRRVIIDLSWPQGLSVNAGIDKDLYLGWEFALSFSSTDDVTQSLKRIGPGAHIYKIDISSSFYHVKTDLLEYDLLGLYWNTAYVEVR